MFRPDLIEYNKLTKVNPLQNLNNAFNVADQKLGLTPLLDAEGEVNFNIMYVVKRLMMNSDAPRHYLNIFWTDF